MYIYIYIYIYIYVYIYIYMCTYLFMYLYLFYLFIYLSINLFLDPYIPWIPKCKKQNTHNLIKPVSRPCTPEPQEGARLNPQALDGV